MNLNLKLIIFETPIQFNENILKALFLFNIQLDKYIFSTVVLKN